MATKNYYDDVTHVVYISTNIGKGCEHCDEAFRNDSVAESINHYIEAHGYRLLHVGTDTNRTSDGDLWHSTIAILGK